MDATSMPEQAHHDEDPMSDLERPRPWWRKIRARVGLRTLMVTVLAAGGGLGWLVHRANVQRRAAAAIAKAGGSVYYDFQLTPGRPLWPGAPSAWPKWLIDAVGVDYFHGVVGFAFGPHARKDADALPTDALMAQVGRLDRLSVINLDNAQGRSLTDADLAHLRGLDRLRRSSSTPRAWATPASPPCPASDGSRCSD